ncbi:hypothetical protein LJR066_002132 [Acidovorax sp. LjRoot66]|uniref:hypothetical protein n=1 Tax=Acidovorax sp. LjRoot66 TaxID=3342334 RepID=UPI003ECFEBCD
MSLIDSFLAPDIAADRYTRSPDAVAYQISAEGSIAAEVFSRSDGTLGFRFMAWVAWRDAGGNARSHAWEAIHPNHGLVTDRIEVAQEEATRYAAARGVALQGNWDRLGARAD